MTETMNEQYEECFEAVFGDTQMNEITLNFLREFWGLAYQQGRLQGVQEGADRIFDLMERGVN